MLCRNKHKKKFDIHGYEQNEVLAESFGRHLEALGVKYGDVTDMYGSTDMGNVSYVVPSLHPNYAIGSGEVKHN